MQRHEKSILEFAGELCMISSKVFPDGRNWFAISVFNTSTIQVQLMKDMSSTIDAEVEMAWKLEEVELAQKCLYRERRNTDQLTAAEIESKTSMFIRLCGQTVHVITNAEESMKTALECVKASPHYAASGRLTFVKKNDLMWLYNYIGLSLHDSTSNAYHSMVSCLPGKCAHK